MTKARLVLAIDDEYDACAGVESDYDDHCDTVPSPSVSRVSSRRVQVQQSPYLMAFHNHHQIRVLVDSGAETNMFCESIAYDIDARVTKLSQAVHQAVSPLDIRGETKIILIRDSHKLVLEALVVRGLRCNVLGGVPFMEAKNSIRVLPHKHQITIGNDILRSDATRLRAPTVPTVDRPEFKTM